MLMRVFGWVLIRYWGVIPLLTENYCFEESSDFLSPLDIRIVRELQKKSGESLNSPL